MTTATNTVVTRAKADTKVCICPLCKPRSDASGVFFCKPSREHVTYDNGLFIASGDFLPTQEALNDYRYQILSRAANAVAVEHEADPEFSLTFDVAAATANTDAEITAFISDVASAQTPEPLYIPFIYYSPSASGFVFGDEGRAYNNMTDADNARTEWLKSEAKA